MLIPFFKYLKKNILTNLEHSWVNFFAHTLFQIFKKAYLRIWKYLGQSFWSAPFSTVSRSILINLKKTWGIFFAHTLFQIFKKTYLPIWKYLGNFLDHTLFQIFKKAYLRIWKIPTLIFFPVPFFKCLKKDTYESEKHLGQFLCLYHFWNI